MLSRLGSGGMGAVYHVFDRELRTRVALKTVGIVDGEPLLRFKREFRALQDLGHPNLISLGELFEVDGEWFYTMELIDGVDFMRYVRIRPGKARPWAPSTETSVAGRNGEAPEEYEESVEPPVDEPTQASLKSPSEGDDEVENTPQWKLEPPGFDEIKLRRSLAQLAEGLHALHRAQKVHRDIKPSNVLVTREGRVVILDFGLVTEMKRGAQESDVGIMGTYPYMSPEQAAGAPVDSRSDWYSVGVMLYQALTGRLPFRGTTQAVLLAKLNEEAPEARASVSGIPEDLNSLCRDLLRRRVEERPAIADIFSRLHMEPSSDVLSLHTASRSFDSSPFIGRQGELIELRTAFERLVDQKGSTIAISGESGIGKSELVSRFLDRLEERNPEAVIFRSRCFERESVPFRSVDGLVDALSGHLMRLADDQLRRVVPKHAELVARAFPVLKRVDAFSGAEADEIRDPQEQRARLFGALRSILVKIATMDPLVIVIDDLQWIDEDSRALLGEVLREPGAPQVLFIATVRTSRDDTTRAELLAHIFGDLRYDEMKIEPLGEAEALELAEKLLRDETGNREARIEQIVRESKGHPFFLDELARHAGFHRGMEAKSIQLDDAIRQRVATIRDDCQDVLRIVALAGSPMTQEVIARACQLVPEDFHRHASTLRALRLVRTTGVRQSDRIEAYHARIAESVLAAETEAQKQKGHDRLARALEAGGDADPVALATHWAGAGQKRKAAVYAVKGAQKAEEALAFDRAAALYRMSLELHPEEAEDLAGRHVKLARALANAGRGYESGQTYLVAVQGAKAAEAIDLRRRAAEQFLLGGHIALGIASFREVLAAVGIRYPERTWQVIFSLLWVRTLIFLRGYRFVQADESMLSPMARLKADTCHSAALGLTATDTMRGLDFYGRSLLLSLDLGEPGRIASHMAVEASQMVAQNGRNRQKAFRGLQEARDLATRSGSAHARGVVTYAEGMAYYLLGQWPEAADALLRADRLFREECAESPAEFRTLQACVIHCYWELGEWRELQQRTSRAIKESEERGDLFTEATIRSGLAMQAHCMRNEGELGLERGTATIEAWTGPTFDVQRYMYHVHGAYAAAYLDDVDTAYERVSTAWNLSRRSMLAWVQLMRAGIVQVRALMAIARAAKRPELRKQLLSAALKDARYLEKKENVDWTRAGAAVIRANVHAMRGQRHEALSWFDLATAECERARMQGRAMACRWAKGLIIGGQDGEALVEAARAWMRDQNVAAPDRFVRSLSPVLFLVDANGTLTLPEA